MVFHADFKPEPYWWEAYKPVAGDLVDVPARVRVAIVGGGYGGLATAQIVNTKAAESRIRDANMAEESAAMTRYNILTQSGIAALAQANSSASSVLTLLR